MCGIAGVVTLDGALAEARQVKAMLGALHHRGRGDAPPPRLTVQPRADSWTPRNAFGETVRRTDAKVPLEVSKGFPTLEVRL